MIAKSEKQWYAVYTRSRQEQKVFDLLIGQGVDCFLPKIEVVKQYSDRKKRVSEVLFKSYIFVNSTPKQQLSIVQTYGVVGFVRFEGKPVPIPEVQIDAVKRFILSKDTKLVAEEDFLLGQKVKIIKGPFKEQKGSLIKIDAKDFVVIELEAIHSYIPIHIHKAFLKKMD